MHNINFPFPCILGQDTMKLGLLLNVIDPQIGGVLLVGKQGTGKSTTVRSVADVLPDIEVVEGCPNNCNPWAQPTELCPSCQAKLKRERVLPAALKAVPVVNLPLSVTEEMISGSLNMEALVKYGDFEYSPGLLAKAHRGILYIDEINLLPAHLVNLLLDAASTGVNIVEREGFSIAHPARFILVGSMNLEEGELRPQISDRFGLKVEIQAPTDPILRANITKTVLEFQEYPAAVVARERGRIEALRDQLQSARLNIDNVEIPPNLYIIFSRIVSELEIPSQRVEMKLVRCARAHAALQGRWRVNEEDTVIATYLVLQLTISESQVKKVLEEESNTPETIGNANSNTDRESLVNFIESLQAQFPAGSSAEGVTANNTTSIAEQIQKAKERLLQETETSQTTNPSTPSLAYLNLLDEEKFLFSDLQPVTDAVQKKVTGVLKKSQISRKKNDFSGRGRRTRITSDQKGHYVAYRKPLGAPRNIAFDATLREYLIQQGGRGVQLPIHIPAEAIRTKIFQFKAPLSLFFILDASGSMRQVIQQMADVILAMQAEGYKKKDKFSLIVFRGKRAHVLIRPTTNLHIALRNIRSIQGDSCTPMAKALRKAIELVKIEKHKDKDRIPVIIICSDCGANVSERCPNLVAGVEADYKTIVDELREITREVSRWGIKLIVITPRKGWTTNAFDATAITNAIKNNFARFAGGEVFQYEKWDPKSMIISLKQQL